jgi:zinc protease
MATQPQRAANSVPELAPERQVRWPKRTKSKLSNGLEVILLESHTIPKFHGELYFRCGNASAASRGTALAEMAASMVRTGTSQHSSREIEEHLRGLGADLSVNAGQDNSSISFAGLSDHAEPLLQLVNELAREATFPAAEFERERRQKLEEVKLERTQPGFLAGPF